MIGGDYMCECCTLENPTQAKLLKFGNAEEYRGEMCQIFFFGKDGDILHRDEEATAYLLFFNKEFNGKPAGIKINNCPWCGCDLTSLVGP